MSGRDSQSTVPSTDPVSYAFPSEHDGHPSCERMPHGLTKRELFAAMAMQGMMAAERPEEDFVAGTVSRRAVAFADGLLAALDVSEKAGG